MEGATKTTELPPTPLVLPTARDPVHIPTRRRALERWLGVDSPGLATPCAPRTAGHSAVTSMCSPGETLERLASMKRRSAGADQAQSGWFDDDALHFHGLD